MLRLGHNQFTSSGRCFRCSRPERPLLEGANLKSKQNRIPCDWYFALTVAKYEPLQSASLSLLFPKTLLAALQDEIQNKLAPLVASRHQPTSQLFVCSSFTPLRLTTLLFFFLCLPLFTTWTHTQKMCFWFGRPKFALPSLVQMAIVEAVLALLQSVLLINLMIRSGGGSGPRNQHPLPALAAIQLAIATARSDILHD